MSRTVYRLVHPTDCICGGEGWLWGRELLRPSEETSADTMTRYSCDREWHDEDMPPGPEPEHKIAKGEA